MRSPGGVFDWVRPNSHAARRIATLHSSRWRGGLSRYCGSSPRRPGSTVTLSLPVAADGTGAPPLDVLLENFGAAHGMVFVTGCSYIQRFAGAARGRGLRLVGLPSGNKDINEATSTRPASSRYSATGAGPGLEHRQPGGLLTRRRADASVATLPSAPAAERQAPPAQVYDALPSPESSAELRPTLETLGFACCRALADHHIRKRIRGPPTWIWNPGIGSWDGKEGALLAHVSPAEENVWTDVEIVPADPEPRTWMIIESKGYRTRWSRESRKALAGVSGAGYARRPERCARPST